jgi:SAM-dependent methyltransferase
MSASCADVLDEVRSTIRQLLEALDWRQEPAARLLDVGCWDGAETVRSAGLLNARPYGIEIFTEPAAEAERRGVEVARLDLECSRFPWTDGSFDVVIANQVFEHLKNIWLPMSEILRVTRDGGWLVISAPNLGSLHNRVLMLAGMQPTSIRTFGPHVRGYTGSELLRFVRLGDAYELVRRVGVGFYPLSARLAAPLARAWPGASHTTVLLLRKRPNGATSPWHDYIAREGGGLQTLYGWAADGHDVTDTVRPGPA